MGCELLSGSFTDNVSGFTVVDVGSGVVVLGASVVASVVVDDGGTVVVAGVVGDTVVGL